MKGKIPESIYEEIRQLLNSKILDDLVIDTGLSKTRICRMRIDVKGKIKLSEAVKVLNALRK